MTHKEKINTQINPYTYVHKHIGTQKNMIPYTEYFGEGIYKSHTNNEFSKMSVFKMSLQKCNFYTARIAILISYSRKINNHYKWHF